MAYQKKTWHNEEDTEATDSNSVANKTNFNDLESRILGGFNTAGINENCKGISNKDLNTICENQNGFYSGTNLTNAPNNAKNIWFKVLHISMNDVYKTQLAFNSSTGTGYYRSCVNGTWQDWETIAKVEDSGWKDLTLASGITVGTIKKTAQYRKVGKIVQLRGDVAGITQTNTLVATLPSEYRPSTRIDCLQPLSGMRYCRYHIDPSGQIFLEWVSDNNYSLNWYNIDINFMVS